MLGCQASDDTHLSMHHQKSSSDSPRQANTEKPASAIAAATSFCNDVTTSLHKVVVKALKIRTLPRYEYSTSSWLLVKWRVLPAAPTAAAALTWVE